MNPPEGCRFAPRCWMARDLCKTKTPELKTIDEKGHSVGCHFWEESRELAAKVQEQQKLELAK